VILVDGSSARCACDLSRPKKILIRGVFLDMGRLSFSECVIEFRTCETMQSRLFHALTIFSVAWLSVAIRTADAATVTRVAAGNNGAHSLFLTSDGSVWGMGYNGDGELGDGSTNNVFVPEEVLPSGITNIGAGGYDSFFIKSDGSLWGTGYNFYGELGDGSTNNQYAPIEIVSSGVIAVAGGDDHTLFLKSDGSLWGMGYNADGELGIGTTNDQSSPVEIVSGGVKAISAGGYHSLFIKSDGSLWGMGYNASGQLGNGSTSRQLTPIKLIGSNVAAIAAGFNHTLVVESNGTLWVTGDNTYGELGDGTQTSRSTFELVAGTVTAAAAGDQFSLFLKTGGSLWSMGHDQWGQLGNGEFFRSLVPFEVVGSGVTGIAAGFAHSLFVQSNGTLWDMGDDNQGQLGDNGAWVNNGENTPQQIDFVHLTSTVVTTTPLAVQFTSAATDFYGSNILAWNWSFGDGASSSSQNPGHTYFFQGVYTPILTVTFANGTDTFTAPGGPYVVPGLVQNGGFETGNFSDWTFPDGEFSVDVSGNPRFVHSGHYGADLYPSTLGYMAQTLTTVPGQSYLLSFWLNSDGRTPNEFQVFWNGDAIMDLVNIASNDWANFQFGVTATGASTVLEFGYQDQPSDLGLDDIGVTAISLTGSYTASPTNTIAPEPVQFTAPSHDSTSHVLTNWSWSFGDGASSSAQNPSHAYTSVGTFTPTLLAINNSGLPVIVTGPQITVAAPAIQFAAAPTNGAAPLTVQFTSPAVDTGGSAITNWQWNFGDGSTTATSTNQNPSHTYATQGTFTPALVTVDAAGVSTTGTGPTNITTTGLVLNSSFEDYNVTNEIPDDWVLTNGAFISQNVAHSGTNSLEFYGQETFVSQDIPTVPGAGYLVSFWANFRPQYGGGYSMIATWNGVTIATLTNQPIYTWVNAQAYLVATETNAVLQFESFLQSFDNGSIYLDDVSVTPAEVEPFTATPTNGPAPLMVQFTAPATDTFGHAITNWQWNFGDGSPVVSAQNPSHTYTQLGTYQPTLVATNNLGLMVPGAQGAAITVRLPTVQIAASPTNGTAPLAVQFTVPATDDSGHAVTNWQWNFGDGTTSPLQNPRHTYNDDGTNFPTLIGTNNMGVEVVAAGPPIVVAYSGGLVENGDFQTGNFTDWSVTGSFTYVNSSFGHLGSSSASFYGPVGSSAFAQTLSTTAGTGYVISFWLWGGPGNNLALSWNGTNLAFPTNLPLQPVWTNVQIYAVAADTNSILQFSTISNSLNLPNNYVAEISVFPAEVEPVTASPLTGPVPLTVQFSTPATDTFGNAVATWDWDFGDGSPHSSEQSPSHTYSKTGLYYPELNATFADGTAVPATVPMISGVLPSIQFTANPTNGFSPMVVQFSAPGVDNTGRTLTNWSWNFGDGTTSAVQNPLHIYTVVSDYAPTLVAMNELGIEVLSGGPGISVNFDSGLVTNGGFESGDYYSGWTVTGGDYGGFPHSGMHSAELTSTTIQHLSQTLPTVPGQSYLLSFWLYFYNSAPTGGEWIVSWNGSVLANEINFLSFDVWTNMQFLVTATTSNTTLDFAFTNENTLFYLDDVSVLPTAQFTATPTNGAAPLSVQFNSPTVDTAGNAITNWIWSFGDGGTGSGQNPSHTYAASGRFSPTLVFVNSTGAALDGLGPLITVSFNAGIVSNGGFETGTFQGWTSSAGSISTSPTYVHSGKYGVQIGPGSIQYISQTLGTTPGTSYILTCWLDSPNGETPNEFSVSWNGTTLLDDHNLQATGWQPYEFNVTATGASTLLKFGFQNGPSWFGFDDVSVIPQSSAPSLGLISIALSGSNLVISGTNGQSGATYRLLTSTNLTLPLSQWTPVLTNTLVGSGNFNLTDTNAVNSGGRQTFFILQSP
jgi:PKD repeat protein